MPATNHASGNGVVDVAFEQTSLYVPYLVAIKSTPPWARPPLALPTCLPHLPPIACTTAYPPLATSSTFHTHDLPLHLLPPPSFIEASSSLNHGHPYNRSLSGFASFFM